MTTINSIKELEKYVKNKHNLNKIINDSNVHNVLIKEAERLEGYLKQELKHHFDTYEPAGVHERTGNTVKSIKVTTPKKINQFTWTIGIEFDESLANHRSYIGTDQPDGYTPWLLEVGWDIRNKIPYDAYGFTHFNGTHYIKKAVEKYNKSNPYGLIINVSKDGKNYI